MADIIKQVTSQYQKNQETMQYQKRVFIYVRVSTQIQAEEGYSIPQQIERLTKYCEAMGWYVVKIYTDDGYSGGDLDRPAMKQMIKDLEKGNADIVLVDKLDRLSRSQFDTLYMIQKVFDPHNVGFVSRAESFDTSTPFGKAMVGILAVFAELERSRIKERMIDGKEGRAKDGKYQGGGKVPIGYRYDKDKDELVIDEYEAIQIKEAFDLLLEHTPHQVIANILNNKGYRHRYGEWQRNTFRSVFPNPIYTGKIKYKGNIYQGNHMPIISEDVFERAQMVLEKRDKDNEKFKPGKRYKSPLGGMIWCAHCGAKYMWRRSVSNRDGSSRGYYVCYSRAKSDPKLVKDPNCKNKNYRDIDLEQMVYEHIRKLSISPDYAKSIQASVDTTAHQDVIKKRIHAIESQISKLMDLYSFDGIDMETLRKKIEPLNAERNKLEEELAELEEIQAHTPVEEITTIAQRLDIILTKKPIYIHAFIEVLIKNITIDGEDVHINWNF